MKSLIAILCVFFLWVPRIEAVYDPRSVPNNKVGIHVADTNDISQVAPLVNSSGGDWGYVTVVISDTDKNVAKWQQIFDQMRRLHLIPLVRLATHVQNAAWVRPNPVDNDSWVSFFTSLNWPVENRYVIMFNEPNHANEWGNSIDPEGYGDLVVELAHKLKEKSEDFFILPAGLDVSAASDGRSLDAYQYLSRVVGHTPEFLSVLDGWNSHSYPNPGFVGSPYARGRGTVGSFDWELSTLRGLGLTKDLPVFITETGWQHNQGKSSWGAGLSPETVGEYLAQAFASVWADVRVVAVTPFVFSYQDYPFDHFSFKKIGSDQYYAHYSAYKDIPKTDGQPKQRIAATFQTPLLPSKLVAGSTYTFSAIIKNTGQGILDPSDGDTIRVADEKNSIHSWVDPIPVLAPGQVAPVTIHLKTPTEAGEIVVSVSLVHQATEKIIEKQRITLVPPPTLQITTPLGWRKQGSSSDVMALVYDTHEQLVHKFTDQKIEHNSIKLEGLVNVVPGEAYRVVVVVPYYLPRQYVVKSLSDGNNILRMRRLLPLDFDRDGALRPADFWKLLSLQPHFVLSLLFGP